MKQTKLKGAVIMDDIKLIIELLAIGFIISVLFYASGLTVTQISNFMVDLIIDILKGFATIITKIIEFIIGGIVSAITNAISFTIHLL